MSTLRMRETLIAFLVLLPCLLGTVVIAQSSGNSSGGSPGQYQLPLGCNPNSTIPGLTWCQYNNPFVLSDFLSRNSTTLTTPPEKAGSSFLPFEVHKKCRWVPPRPGLDDEEGHMVCTAIQQIGSGSFGILPANAADLPDGHDANPQGNMSRYVVFTDLDGQMLFVDFNNNTMADSTQFPKIGTIRFFDIALVKHVDETEEIPVQDMVMLVANSTAGGLILLNGRTKKIEPPCYLFRISTTWTNNVHQELVYSEFFPRSSKDMNSSLSLAWMWAVNYTLMNYWNGDQIYSWMNDVHYYMFQAVPAKQSLIKDYVRLCPHHENSSPMNITFFLTMFALKPVIHVKVLHNHVSNITLYFVASQSAVNVFKVSYSGEQDEKDWELHKNHVYKRFIPILPTWCSNYTLYNVSDDTYKHMTRQPSTVFCVSDSSHVEITTFSVFSPDDFTDIGNFTKDVWITIGLKDNRTGRIWVHIMDFAELVNLPENASQFDNPLGLREDFGLPSYPCPHFDREVWSWENQKCEPRFFVELNLTDNEEHSEGARGGGRFEIPISDIVVKVIQPNMNQAPKGKKNSTDNNHTSSNSSSSSSSGGWIPEIPVPIVQQEHSTIFVARGREVRVYTMFTDRQGGFSPPNTSGINLTTSVIESDGNGTAGNNTGRPIIHIELENQIHFIGDVQSMHVSENAQHLFVAVSRHEWELEAQDRYDAICHALEKDPKDPFALPYKKNCDQYPPQEVNLNSFTQYASYCTYNLYCPSLDQVTAQLPQERYYADRPAVQKPCPRGFFCTGGFKMACPPGFYCDELGLTSPKKCNVSSNFSVTCSEYQQTEPKVCPDGTVCFVTHIPGIPVAPGRLMPKPPTLRTNFINCSEGMWCNLGAQEPYNGSTRTESMLDCPSLTFCVNASVEEPVKCECDAQGYISDGKGAMHKCDERTLYCPPGTKNISWCPAGYYCTFPNISDPCVPTQYCPEGTFAPQLCPAGFFCPAPAWKIECPSSHFCPRGTVQPQACNFLTLCPLGSESQSRSFLAPFVLILVIVGVLIGFWFFTRMKKGQSLAEEKASPLSAAARSFLESGGADGVEEGEHTPLMVNIPTSLFQTPMIRFEQMGLTLQVGEHKGKVVLDNVTGSINPGSFVAVMGPSGSGKSTFMHTLSGKAFYGQRSGKVLVNGDEVDLNHFSKVIGFVKQDDIMLREMTVAETLLFNARMRYDPRSMDAPEGIANAFLKVLDLDHVRHVNIGDEKRRGISGGQRKRVNIGMEMVSLPAILFLDEPTSGLDSSSSMTVCSALRDMANIGHVSIIAVIHQPRFEIFQMFHKVLLLAKGGKLVYYGDPNDALPYFENELGYTCPAHVNPPDFFMDVISGDEREVNIMVEKWKQFEATKGEGGGAMTKNRFEGKDRRMALNQADRSSVISMEERSGEEGTTVKAVGNSKESGVGASSSPLIPGSKLLEEASKKSIAGFCSQLSFFTARSFVQLSRDLVWFFTDLFLVLIAGFFLGLVFSKSEYRPPLPMQIVNKSLSCFNGNAPPMLHEFFNRPVDDPIISEASLTCMAIGMTGITAALRVFGNEQLVYWREASAGMSTPAYFLAKNFSHIFFIILSPLLYLAPFLTFVSARASILHYYRVAVLIQFTTTGLGYLVSIVVPPGLAQLAGVVTVLVFSMFGGARPTLVEIKEMFPLLRLMPYLSYIRWAQEALYIEEISEWNKVEGVKIQPSLDLFDYHLDNYATCMLITAAFGVVFRVLALIAMMIMNRDQKH